MSEHRRPSGLPRAQRLTAVCALAAVFFLMSTTATAVTRTVSPPPPWMASNVDEIISRAWYAVDSWYRYGYESWGVDNSGTYVGPDCSGLVLKAWEVPDTLYYREEDNNDPNVNWDANIDFQGTRYSVYSFYNTGDYWDQPSFTNRAMGDAAAWYQDANNRHMVLIHYTNWQSQPGWDKIIEAKQSGTQVREIVKNLNTLTWHIARRNYMEYYPTHTYVLDNPTAGMSGPEPVFGWRISSGPLPPYSGEGYQYVNGGDTAHARWVPYFEITGTFKVYARYSPAATRTTNAVYHVHSTNGDHLVSVNQRSNVASDHWYLLGYFHFNQGYDKFNGAVDLYAPTSDGGNLVADAMKFEYLGY
ncbi:MAG: hypothetical protein Kow00122_04380 [Thermoleophilia bacterium]